jgi:phosphatidate cytidylyltransferase
MQLDIGLNVLRALGGLYAILVAASASVLWLRWRAPENDRTELVQRIRSWWLIVAIFSIAVIMSRNVSVAFFAFVSFLALKEYLSIVPTRRADRRVLFWAYLAIPVQYYWVAEAWYGMFIIFIPVYVFLLLPLRMVLIGETRNFCARREHFIGAS